MWIDGQLYFVIQNKFSISLNVQLRNCNFADRDTKSLTLINCKIDKKRLQKIARKIADAILGNSIDIELNFFDVATSYTAIVRKVFKQGHDLHSKVASDSFAFAGG
jgi:hypothetical protein